jgi:lipopolysaccharide biosynthesis protein
VTGGISEQRKETLEAIDDVKVIAFYLPQFHPIPENDLWWGKGFTEWTNVIKAKPNFEGHYQPHVPAQLGYYDLRVPEVMNEQARMAQQYGIHGFCYYYYWFGGKRLLEMPIERMLRVGQPNIPYCLCWANENWTRRWDGREHEILISQSHSDDDDARVIRDIIRYFRSANYIRVNGRPLLLVYRATLFPDFRRTASIWRDVCGKEGIRDIYLALVESFDLVGADVPPDRYGCDASVEFPPQGMADLRPPSGRILNANFRGFVADYRDLVARYASRPVPKYKRFRGVMPGWDNTPRRQDDGICFENATPGAFQAWLENAIEQTKAQFNSDERLLFVNAWNEWAEGAHLEPDRRFGDAFLQAVVNAKNKSAPDAKRIMVCPTDPARVGA